MLFQGSWGAGNAVILEAVLSIERQDAKLNAKEVKLAANTPEATEILLLELPAGE